MYAKVEQGILLPVPWQGCSSQRPFILSFPAVISTSSANSPHEVLGDFQPTTGRSSDSVEWQCACQPTSPLAGTLLDAQRIHTEKRALALLKQRLGPSGRMEWKALERNQRDWSPAFAWNSRAPQLVRAKVSLLSQDIFVRPLARLETFYVKPNCACRDAIDSRKAVHEPTGAIFPALNSHFGLPVPGIAAIHRLELVLVNTRRLGRSYLQTTVLPQPVERPFAGAVISGFPDISCAESREAG